MYKILTTLILLFVSTLVCAEFDFDTYQPINFSALKARHQDDLLSASQKSDFTISAASFKYRMPLIFTKQLRKISADNMRVIKAWQKTLRVPDNFVNLYQQEFKVMFGKETYWIPVQEALLPDMGSELHPGDKFELYVIVIGAMNNQLVFLTTEFKSEREPL